MSYIYQNNGLASSLNETPSETAAFSQGFQDGNNSLNNIPHKGIFHPEPNILICRANCCYKYLGLYPILFGLTFGSIFIPTGLKSKKIVFALIGSIFFSVSLIAGICLFCNIKAEIKFVVSYPMIEIIASSMCLTNKKVVSISEIENIIFEYRAPNNGNGIYQILRIIYTNGERKNYFGFNSSPPCFTEYEVDYFNNEIKKLLRK